MEDSIRQIRIFVCIQRRAELREMPADAWRLAFMCVKDRRR